MALSRIKVEVMEPDPGAANSGSGCGSLDVSGPLLMEASEDPYGHGAQMLKIFPEEIWLLVLEKLKDKDLETVSNASPFFRNLLLPHRVHFLFPKVWALLCASEKYDKYIMHCGVSGMDMWEVHRYSQEFKKVPNGRDPLLFPETPEIGQREVTSTGLLSPAFWYSGILKLRLVSKSWCNVIDGFYQNHPRHTQIGQDPARSLVRTTCWTDFIQKQENDFLSSRWEGRLMSSFLDHFKNTHDPTTGDSMKRNPFISRKVSVLYQFGNGQRNMEVWNRLSQFLTKYGEHIWYLDLRLSSDPNVPTREKLSKLRQLLGSLKNVKVLKIISPILRPSHAERLEAVVLEEPLPKLEQLQFLSTSFVGSILYTHLLESNDHVKSLEIQNRGVRCNFEEICTVPLQNLKDVSLIVDSPVSFKRLGESSLTSWKLEKVSLDFWYAHSIEWEDIFKMIGDKWAGSLTEVQLRMTRQEETDDIQRKNKLLEKCGTLRLNLPKVKRLRVALTSFSSLDFILPMRDSLEYLDVDVCFELRCSKLACQVQRKQIIQFLGYTSKLLNSNIWKVFPKLKQYRIFEKDLFLEPAWSFTRKDWELSSRK